MSTQSSEEFINSSEERKRKLGSNNREEREKEGNKKVKVGFYISEPLVERFRTFVIQKYSKYERGFFSSEVELCLKYWLDLHTKSHDLKMKVRPTPPSKIVLAFAEVRNYLLSSYIYMELPPRTEIPRVHLEKAIANVRGSDRRTIQKLMEIFHKMGFIELITPNLWKLNQV
ncbi:MAG: hypothetical protein QW486_00320 [Candidatus Bathyarchaeia archaeon]